ncbi:MAG TPA: hypothetical protein PLU10_05300 [Chitinophagaceae bacterium]|nr:hypothetical protein [Chitinophagaceae bacterium]
MKTIRILVIFLLTAMTLHAQQNINIPNHPERKASLQSLRLSIEKELKQPVKFVVNQLRMEKNYAFFSGQVKDAQGKDIDFRKTPYRELVMNDMFDGDATYALLKKVKGVWKVVTYVIGPTDVAWGDWPSKYGVSAKLCGFEQP